MEPITIKGSHFFYEQSGLQFFVRGIKYQYNPPLDRKGAKSTPANILQADPLIDIKDCERDIPFLKELGINTILVEYIRPDPETDHSPCMNAFQKAGIYVVVHLEASNESINQLQNWDRELKARWLRVVDNMAPFVNVLGFLSPSSYITYAFLKAAIRDVKKYIITKSYRQVPIISDGWVRGKDTLQPLNCGDKNSSIDVLFTHLEKCSDDTVTQQSIALTRKTLGDYPSPVVYMAQNCGSTNSVGSLHNIFDSNATSFLSGAIMSSYFGDFISKTPGIMDVEGYNATRGPQYATLSKEIASVQPSPTSIAQYTPTNTIPSVCESHFPVAYTSNVTPSGAVATMDFHIATSLPPTPNRRLCECMMASLECVASQQYRPQPFWIDAPRLSRNYPVPQENALKEGICKENPSWCLGSGSDPSVGQWGSFGGCNATERGSWILNRAFKAKNSDAGLCQSLNGTIIRSTVQDPPNDCKIMLAQAGPQGTGEVTYSAPELSREKRPGDIGDGATPSGSRIIPMVVVPVVLLLFIIGLLLFYLRWRRNNMKKQDEVFEKAELPGDAVAAKASSSPLTLNTTELSVTGNELNEADPDTALVELSGRDIQELDGVWNEMKYDVAETVYVELPTEFNTRGKSSQLS
ncbi:hypothetical protein BT63DRAFT_458535 [Microthyrium microscopicum]|uniref:1,3-beta-glucanosyltransferase n=1 Tax=Microthyrium microscopicum TaxID=703497 RepID=A0A6A6U228_9PEZI|nr:hypothetical protein BT63DRAFT_458535 [Microthyrium microscopicum]